LLKGFDDALANSYSFAAMNACIAAERALEVLREALEAEAET